MPTFKHSGDLGDIIYALPAVRALGGGTLLLDVNGGATDPWCRDTCLKGRTKFARPQYDTIRPLLLQQPYVTDVRIWDGEQVDHNLDQFRRLISTDNKLNLVTAHLREFGLPEVLDPWLTVTDPPIKLHRPVVINRTVRYHAAYHWWATHIGKIAPTAVFIGHEKEHDIFQYTFDCQLPFHRPADALEIARILLGATFLIANQSFVLSVAHGLGTPFYQEAFPHAQTCLFDRANGRYL
jgi:hypothetical protein